MATIRFYTRSGEKDKLVPVHICFQDKTEFKIRLVTPFLIYPEYWDEKKQRMKPNSLYSEKYTEEEALKAEDQFKQLSRIIQNEYYKAGSKVSKEWLQGIINKSLEKKAPKEETLNQYIKRFIEEARSGIRLASIGSTKKRYSPGSIRNLNDFRNSFNLFQGIEPEEGTTRKRKSRKKYPKQPYKPLNFSDINIDTYNNFLRFFYDRDCGANYIGKHIKSLKTIMRQAREEGLHNNQEIERKAFKTISEEVEHIYLTEAELKDIHDLDLSKEKHLSQIRDVFLVGCHTAQRYSDYSKIDKSNIKEIEGNKVIELIQKKTGEKCLIPVRPELEEILQRYDNALPKTYEHRVNKGIKKLGSRAKINELIQVEKNKGGLKVKTSVKKYELIKTHTARRTGCTLMYLAGIPVIDIMKISGHRTPKEFMKYIRIGKEETAVKLAAHPYFKGNTLKVAN